MFSLSLGAYFLSKISQVICFEKVVAFGDEISELRLAALITGGGLT